MRILICKSMTQKQIVCNMLLKEYNRISRNLFINIIYLSFVAYDLQSKLVVYWSLLLEGFPVLLRNRLIYAGLEPVLSNTEKSFITSYYRQISTIIKIKILKLITVLLVCPFVPSGLIKLGSYLRILFIVITTESCL